MSNATVIDEKVLNGCINEITRVLLQSIVQFKLVRDMQTNIKKIVNLDDLTTAKRSLWMVMPFKTICSLQSVHGYGHFHGDILVDSDLILSPEAIYCCDRC